MKHSKLEGKPNFFLEAPTRCWELVLLSVWKSSTKGVI